MDREERLGRIAVAYREWVAARQSEDLKREQLEREVEAGVDEQIPQALIGTTVGRSRQSVQRWLRNARGQGR